MVVFNKVLVTLKSLKMDLFLQTAFDKFSVIEGLFVVEKGKRKHQFNPAQINQIWLNHKVAVEGEVIQLALKNRINIIFLSTEGFPIGSIAPYNRKNGIAVQAKQWQLAQRPDAATYVSTYLFKGQLRRFQFVQTHLSSAVAHPILDTLTTIIQTNQKRFVEKDLPFPNELQEAYFAKTYFAALNLILPPAFQFAKRSRRPAQDAFNALLNYALGWLYAMVNNAVRKAKLDPYIGFHHRPKDGNPALVFDLIEAYRPWVEMACIQLVLSQKIQLTDFESLEEKKGVIIAKPARKKIIQYVHQSFQETHEAGNKLDNIYQDAREFAIFLNNYDFL